MARTDTAEGIMMIDMRCRVTVAGSADYFLDRATKFKRLDKLPALSDGSMDAFIGELDAAGVTTAVSVSGLNPGATLGRYELPARTTSNDFMAEVQRRHPGRIFGVAGIDVSNQFHDALAELERCASTLGLRAVFIEPGRAPGCLLNDRRLYPLYERCQELKLTLIPQTSGVLGGRLVDYANPRFIEEVADDFPKLNIVCGHGCYPYVREALVMASRRDNVWLSPDSYFFHLGHEDWFRAVNLNLGGAAERFLFGSSYPLTPLKAFVDNFLRLDWKPEVLEKILYRNAFHALRLGEDPVYRKIYATQ